MEEIIGLVMIYAWIHSIVIIVTKTKDTTQYEKGIMLAGAVGFLLFFLGSI